MVPGGVRVVPHQSGRRLDVAATARALQAAAVSPTERTAALVVRVAQPERTIAEARAMGVTDVVSSYATSYGGTEGRLHEEAAEGEAEASRPAGGGRAGGYGRSALATASASQAGTRVGLPVARSTVACAVQPSATSSPARSIRYS